MTPSDDCSTSRWSMATSPNSLMMTAVSASAGSLSSRLSSVVLPAPRKPVSTETGMGKPPLIRLVRPWRTLPRMRNRHWLGAGRRRQVGPPGRQRHVGIFLGRDASRMAFGPARWRRRGRPRPASGRVSFGQIGRFWQPPHPRPIASCLLALPAASLRRLCLRCNRSFVRVVGHVGRLGDAGPEGSSARASASPVRRARSRGRSSPPRSRRA